MGRKFKKQLQELLLQKKAQIVEKWRQAIHNSYPAETAQFLKREKDRFQNPIGSSIEEAIWPLYDQIIGDSDPAQTKKYLDILIRIRAVQDFTPASALKIFIALKEAARDALLKDVKKQRLFDEYLKFENEIDRFTLLAFDVYMECREKIWEIKRNDLLQRPGLINAGMCPSYMMKRGFKHLERLKKESTQH